MATDRQSIENLAMTLFGLMLFAGVYALAAASPGPAIAAVVARVLATGVRRSAPFIWGIVVGDLVWFAMAAFGLVALAERFFVLFQIVKYAGVCYLLFVAYKLWTAPPGPPAVRRQSAAEGGRLFLGGLALTLGNPKVMVFFVSILPLMVDVTRMTPVIVVEITLLIAVVLSLVLWAYAIAAERARGVIASPRAMRIANRGSGTVMVAAAIAVAARS